MWLAQEMITGLTGLKMSGASEYFKNSTLCVCVGPDTWDLILVPVLLKGNCCPVLCYQKWKI